MVEGEVHGMAIVVGTLGLNDRWCLRKHQGELVSTVIREDPAYVEWCLYNVKGFGLDEKASAALDEELDYYYWED